MKDLPLFTLEKKTETEIKIVEKEVIRYTCLQDSMTDLLDRISDDPNVRGLTFFKSHGRWQASLSTGTISNWTVIHDDNIGDAIATLYTQEGR